METKKSLNDYDMRLTFNERGYLQRDELWKL